MRLYGDPVVQPIGQSAQDCSSYRYEASETRQQRGAYSADLCAGVGRIEPMGVRQPVRQWYYRRIGDDRQCDDRHPTNPVTSPRRSALSKHRGRAYPASRFLINRCARLMPANGKKGNLPDGVDCVKGGAQSTSCARRHEWTEG